MSLYGYENRRINIDEAIPIILEKDTWVTINCVVLPGSRIGEGSIIMANSVVNGEIPPNCIAAGNPAKVIKKLKRLDTVWFMQAMFEVSNQT